MPSVTEADLRAILRFLDVAATLDGAHPFPPHILHQLSLLIPAAEVSYFELSRHGRRPGATSEDRERSVIDYTSTSDPGDEDVWDPVLAQWGHQNPVGAVQKRYSPASGPVRQSSVVSKRDLDGLGFYHEFLKPLHITDVLKVWLPSSPGSVACIAFERTDGHFTDREVTLLSVLHRHLAVMRENARARSALPAVEASLSPREAEVLSWAAMGKRNEEIASLLFIAPATVRRHLDHAYEKLGVRSRSEAIARLRLPPEQP